MNELDAARQTRHGRARELMQLFPEGFSVWDAMVDVLDKPAECS